MNAAERKSKLAEISVNLNAAAAEIQSVKEEHEAQIEELSDAAKEGVRGEQLQEIVDALEEAYNGVTDAVDTLGGII